MFGFGKKDSKLKVVKPKVPINTPDTSGPDSGLKQNLGMFSDTASPGTSWKFDKQAGKAKVNLKGEMEIEATRKETSETTGLLSSTPSETYTRDWPSFLIICFVILIGDTARGVMFPTLYPLNLSLHGGRITQGYCVAAFSFGRVIMSPYLGRMSEIEGYRSTLKISLSMLLCGTVLYACAGTPLITDFLNEKIHHLAGLTLLVFAQIVMGLGSGTLGVTRAYVAECTSRKERTKWLSWLTAVQYTGFTVMPVVGALICNSVKEGGWIEGGRSWCGGLFVLNEFTMPGNFMTLVAGLTLALLVTVFKDKKRAKKEVKKEVEVTSGKADGPIDWSEEIVLLGLTRFDATVLGCMLLNVATKGSIAVYETLTVNFATSHFVSMDSERAGYVVSSCGAMGVVALLFMGQIGRVLTDTQMITYGMITMIIGTGLLVHFGDHSHFGTFRFESAVFLLYSVGYPIGHTAVIGIFSKIVGKRPQGALLGYFASAGSVARMFFPIFSGYVAQFLGNSVMFCVLIGVLGVATGIVVMHKETLRRLSTE